MSSILRREQRHDTKELKSDEAKMDYALARRTMVENQIRTFDVTQSVVLTAFETVPREFFVPASDHPFAYLDRRIDVHGSRGTRALLPPLILARLIQALTPMEGERALDVMGGFGYSAAILAACGLDVTALEADEAFAEAARLAVKKLSASLSNRITVAAPVVALHAQEPFRTADANSATDTNFYDVILINGAAEQEPTAFFALLAEGGRLGVILRNGRASRAHIFTKSKGHISSRPIFDAHALILPGFEKTQNFAF